MANDAPNPFVTHITHSRGYRINRTVPIWTRIVARATIPAGNARPYPRVSYARIVWSLRGDGVIPLGNREYRLRQGQFVVWLPDDPQHLRAGPGQWDLAWIVLEGPAQRAILTGLGFEQSAIYPTHYFPEAEFRYLSMVMEEQTPASLLRNSRLTYDLLCRVADRVVQPPDDDLIQEAIAHIQLNLSDPTLSVQTLADLVGMNRSSFTRRFRRQLDQPPLQYINHQRIDRSIELLSSTNKPVAEIARECGWQDASYFARAFRKNVGVLPSTLRGRTKR